MKKLFLLFLFSVFTIAVYSNNGTTNLVKRILPSYSEKFVFTLIENDDEEYFNIESKSGKIFFSGTTQSALNYSLGYYLKNYCYLNFSDCGNNFSMPKNLPPVNIIKKKSLVEIRHAYNYCTFGYTFAFNNWSEWEKEIDRIALMGINQALVLPGHEKVWRNTLLRLGVSTKDIKTFIPSGAFTPWWLMGNLEGVGGPISDELIEKEAELGRKICERYKELGIDPIVNGFFGMVPSFLPKYVKAKYVKQGLWCGFNRPSVLSPQDKAFEKIAKIYYDEVKKCFGSIKYFGGDLFHEGGNTFGLNVTKCAKNVQTIMQKYEPNSIYVLQGWGGNPTKKLLKGLNPEKTLIHQLSIFNKEIFPVKEVEKLKGFNWTYAEVGNFGGNHGMNGNLDLMTQIPKKVNQGKQNKIVGLGLLSEGFERNPIVFDLWSEIYFSNNDIDLNKYLNQYVQSRYGKFDQNYLEAWKLLNESVYNLDESQEGVTDFVFSSIPSTNNIKSRYWCKNNFYWDIEKVKKAGQLLLKNKSDTEGYNFDLVDITRQYLNGLSLNLRNKIVVAYQAGDIKKVKELSNLFLNLFDDLDMILATNENFLLGRDLAKVEKKGTSNEEKKILKESLLQLYTIWQIIPATQLSDYASRSLSGLVKDYYKQRWQLWCESLIVSLEKGEELVPYDTSIIDATWYKTDKTYTTKSIGSTYDVAKNILNKFGDNYDLH